MNRREFLKVSGLTSMILFAGVSPLSGKFMDFQSKAEAVESSGKLYRGTYDGKIYVSEDQGESWSLHTDFGNQISVLGFSKKSGGQLYAHLSYQFRRFDTLLAKDEKFWLTAL